MLIVGFQGFLQTRIRIEICPLTPTNHRGIIHSIQGAEIVLMESLSRHVSRHSDRPIQFSGREFKPVPWLRSGGGGPTPQLRSAAVSWACRSPPPGKKFGRNVSASFARIAPPETKKWHFLWPKVGPQETNWSIAAATACSGLASVCWERRAGSE